MQLESAALLSAVDNAAGHGHCWRKGRSHKTSTDCSWSTLTISMSLPLAEFRTNGGLLLTERCGYTAEPGNLLDPFASLSKESCHIHHTKQLPLQAQKTQNTQYSRSPVQFRFFFGSRPKNAYTAGVRQGSCVFCSQETVYNSVAHEPEVGDSKSRRISWNFIVKVSVQQQVLPGCAGQDGYQSDVKGLECGKTKGKFKIPTQTFKKYWVLPC